MALHHESKLDFFYRVVAPKITSAGAAVVIFGAMFKILHLPGAGVMLGVGLTLEACLFLMFAFQPAPPPEAHYNWELAYPELLGDASKVTYKAKLDKGQDDTQKISTGALAAIDSLLSSGEVSPDAFKKFGQGIKSLNDTTSKMKDMTEAANVTADYANNVKQASSSLANLNKAYATTVQSMQDMSNAAKDAKDFHGQVQLITKNLGALNAVYEMELKDANSHLKALNKFYSNLTTAMESMADASKESQVFKDQMTKLTANITSLNKVYGNMLTAMKG
jgi:gliding motility-associated protein GldL